MKTYIITVSGRVQGVGYRFNCLEKAKRLGIKGTVTNSHTGEVEIVAQGSKIDEFIAWCRKGPSFSRVDSVDVSVRDEPGYKGFRIV
jgi:acylphosphatase